METTAVTALTNQVTCQKMKVCKELMNWKKTNDSYEEDKIK
jgi:hypothetical protein